jgi:hypothetical protein
MLIRPSRGRQPNTTRKVVPTISTQSRKPSKPTPAEEATAARVAAETARDEAAKALANAEAHSADLTHRLDNGDASVTSDATVTAASDIDRRQRLLAAAERKLAAATVEEQVCIAEQAAAETPARLSVQADQAIVSAATGGIADAITSLVCPAPGSVEARNCRLDGSRGGVVPVVQLLVLGRWDEADLAV